MAQAHLEWMVGSPRCSDASRAPPTRPHCHPQGAPGVHRAHGGLLQGHSPSPRPTACALPSCPPGPGLSGEALSHQCPRCSPGPWEGRFPVLCPLAPLLQPPTWGPVPGEWRRGSHLSRCPHPSPHLPWSSACPMQASQAGSLAQCWVLGAGRGAASWAPAEAQTRPSISVTGQAAPLPGSCLTPPSGERTGAGKLGLPLPFPWPGCELPAA